MTFEHLTRFSIDRLVRAVKNKNRSLRQPATPTKLTESILSRTPCLLVQYPSDRRNAHSTSCPFVGSMSRFSLVLVSPARSINPNLSVTFSRHRPPLSSLIFLDESWIHCFDSNTEFALDFDLASSSSFRSSSAPLSYHKPDPLPTIVPFAAVPSASVRTIQRRYWQASTLGIVTTTPTRLSSTK